MAMEFEAHSPTPSPTKIKSQPRTAATGALTGDARRSATVAERRPPHSTKSATFADAPSSTVPIVFRRRPAWCRSATIADDDEVVAPMTMADCPSLCINYTRPYV
ncbi:hypothetical protein Dimus_038582 [Dionaea muscipula]